MPDAGNRLRDTESKMDATTPSDMTDDEFARRYMITSARTSRVYSRRMLLSRASRHRDAGILRVGRADIAAVLDDDSWMRVRRGMVPGAVIEEAIREAAWRVADANSRGLRSNQ